MTIRALQLTAASSQYADIGDPGEFSSLGGELTVEFRVYFDSLPGVGEFDHFLTKSNGTGTDVSFQVYLYNNAGTYELTMWLARLSTTPWTSVGWKYNWTPSVDTWYAVRISGDMVTEVGYIMLDGTAYAGTKQESGSGTVIDDGTSDVRIGFRPSNDYLDGRISHVLVAKDYVTTWDTSTYPLDQVPDHTDYDLANIIGYWKLDGSREVSAEDAVNGNDATYQGSPTWAAGYPFAVPDRSLLFVPRPQLIRPPRVPRFPRPRHGWAFHEGGGDVRDLFGGLHGTPTGGAAWAAEADEIRDSILVGADTSADYVSLGSGNGLLIPQAGTQPWTIWALVRLDDAPGANHRATIFARRGADAGSFIFHVGADVAAGSQKLGFTTYDGSWNEVLGTDDVPLDQWVAVEVVNGGATLQFYIDAVPDSGGTDVWSPPAATASLPMAIGATKEAAAVDDEMDGNVAAVYAWDVPLTASQLMDLQGDPWLPVTYRTPRAAAAAITPPHRISYAPRAPFRGLRKPRVPRIGRRW